MVKYDFGAKSANTFENAVSENNFVLHVGLVWNPGFVGTGILEAGFGLFSIRKLDN